MPPQINSTIGELNLYAASIDSDELMQAVFNLFEADKKLPGIIVLKNNKLYNLLSRTRFYELMSKQFMLEIFSKKSIKIFIEEKTNEENLTLHSSATILEAANKALQREDKYRNDPVIIDFENDKYKLLDFYELITAQTQEHVAALSSLKEANEFKKEVLSMAAHELRNPLMSIQGFSKIIEETITGNTELKEYSGYISDSAKEMNIVLNDLLKSAIDDSKNLELNVNEFIIKDLLHTTIMQFEQIANKKEQKIFFEYQNESKLIVKADRSKIKEVFENLISNAIKYSPYNSNIFIRLKTENNFFRIEFVDQGPGFSNDDMKNIFKKFSRLSAKPTGNESSTGLGLYFVKKITEKHGGIIEVNNNTSGGCTITVYLPTETELTNKKKEEKNEEPVTI